MNSENRILWVYAPVEFPDNFNAFLLSACYEDRSPALLSALQNKLPQGDLVKSVFPEFDEQKHIARLGQEIDRSAGFPVRFLQIFEVLENDSESN